MKSDSSDKNTSEKQDHGDNQNLSAQHSQQDDTDSIENPQSETAAAEHPLKTLLIFQVKLAFDALRDIALSPIALVATIADLVEGKTGRDTHFEKLMKFGRISERHINLFGQHRGKSKTVDSVLQQVEEILVKEYRDGDISAKAKAAIEAKLHSQFKNKSK